MNFMKTLLLTWLFPFISAPVQAQSAFEGDFVAYYAGARGGERQADVRLENQTGTWWDFPKGIEHISNKCVGRSMPVSIVSRTPSSLVFRVERSKLTLGCADIEISVAPVSEQRMEGFIGGRVPIVMQRK